jgi:hypothetical protein
VTDEEEAALVAAFQRPPYSRVGAWNFDYEHPGFFVYWHDNGRNRVYFTPDWEDPGIVGIQIEREPGGEREVHEPPFLSPNRRPEDLFAIVRSYLTLSRRGHGRKAWDPRREDQMGDVEPKLSGRKDWDPAAGSRELAEEIYDFHDYHDVFAGEAYRFNIKLRNIEIPAQVREQISEEAIDRIVLPTMEDALTDFADTLKEKFPWIRAWAQAGRMGGWLVLEPHNPVLTIGHRRDGVAVPDIEPADVKEARKRLRDLEKIKTLIKEEISELVAELQSDDFWADRVETYQPRPKGRKHWDPTREDAP